jgi:hypothetical protein
MSFYDFDEGDQPQEAKAGRAAERLQALDNVEMLDVQAAARVVDPVQAATPEDQKLDRITSELQRMPELQPAAWQKLNDADRLTTLHRAADVIGREYGIERPPIGVFSDANTRLQGVTDAQTGEIGLNRLARDDYGGRTWDNPQAQLETVAHEMRHVYQRAAVHDLNLGVQVDARADAWRDNLGDYTQPDVDPLGYLGQPVEVDARAFADRVVRGVYG